MDRDSRSPTMREQRHGLAGVGPAPLSKSAFASALAEVRDLTPSSAKTTTSRLCGGTRVLEFGEWRGVLLRLEDPDAQCALIRSAIEGSACRVLVDDFVGADLDLDEVRRELGHVAQLLVGLASDPDADLDDIAGVIDALLNIDARRPR